MTEKKVYTYKYICQSLRVGKMYDRNNQLVSFFIKITKVDEQEPVRYSNQSCQPLHAHIIVDTLLRTEKKYAYQTTWENNPLYGFVRRSTDQHFSFLDNREVCYIHLEYFSGDRYLYLVFVFVLHQCIGRLKGKIKKTILSRFFLCNQSCLADMIFLLFFVIDLRLSRLHNKTNFIFSHLFEKNFHLKLYGWHHH